MKDKLKKVIRFLTNPRLLLCVAIAWLITNGWSYILFGVGSYFGIHWMTAVAGGYIAFLWLLFPNDQKTLAVLRHFREKAKAAIRGRREKRASQRERIAKKPEPELNDDMI